MAGNSDKTESVETYVCTNPKFEIKASASAKASVSAVSSTGFSPSSAFTFSLVKPYSLSAFSVSTIKTIGVDMSYAACSKKEVFKCKDVGPLRAYGKNCSIAMADDFALRSTELSIKNLPDGKNTAALAASIAALAANGIVAAVPSVVISQMAQKKKWQGTAAKAKEQAAKTIENNLTAYDKKKEEHASDKEWLNGDEAQDLRKKKLSALLSRINSEAKNCAQIEQERKIKKEELAEHKITQKEFDEWNSSATANEKESKKSLENYKKSAEELAKEIGRYEKKNKSAAEQEEAIKDELNKLKKKIEAEEYDGKIKGKRTAELGNNIADNAKLSNDIADLSTVAGAGVSAAAGIGAALATFINSVPKNPGIRFVSKDGPLDINVFPDTLFDSKFELAALAGAGGTLEASVNAAGLRNMNIQANLSRTVSVNCGSSQLAVSASNISMTTPASGFVISNYGNKVEARVGASKLCIDLQKVSYSVGAASLNITRTEVNANGTIVKRI